MKRLVLISALLLLLLILTSLSVGSEDISQGKSAVTKADPLGFPEEDYTVKNVTVNTSDGQVQVVYRLYEHITYVGNPVDTNYQSMRVMVPIEVDGKEIDASNAPILFVNSVGGYMSASNENRGMDREFHANMSGSLPIGVNGMPPAGMNGTAPIAGMGRAPSAEGGISKNSDLALAAGFVVVEPGCRGRDNQATNGTYYGKAAAAIVDLKAAVRYIRHNDETMPGNANWIISTGVSAGGALSALLGASGSSHLYDAHLKEIGAADENDSIYASAAFCPIADLEHADMAYEWEFGTVPINGQMVDQELSQQLRDAFAVYMASLSLKGENNFGAITADNYGDYLVQNYLIPSANRYLSALTDEERKSYLAENTWISWSGNSAEFRFEDYAAHVGRMKSLPAFDAFDLSAAENIEFGNETTNARHFTIFSLRHASGDQNAEIDSGLTTVVNLMNPMFFISQNNSGCARYWWIRHGTADSNTALTVISNLAISLENRGKDVNALLYWDAGHGADEDAEDFIAWIREITGYNPHLA